MTFSFIHVHVGRVGVVAIATSIYAIGGYDGVSNLNSVEIYNLDNDEWISAPPMNIHQGGVSVAVFPFTEKLMTLSVLKS